MSCVHRFPAGADAILLVHGFPDNVTRGFCWECRELIEPTSASYQRVIDIQTAWRVKLWKSGEVGA